MKTLRWETLDDPGRARALRRPATVGDAGRARAVAAIIDDVRARGDTALNDYAVEFDGVRPESLVASEEDFERALEQVDDAVIAAIDDARRRIEMFHDAAKPEAVRVETAPGVVCERVPRPISPVGLYVPAGSAPLPSTVLMLAVPAVLAGCESIWIATPPDQSGRANPYVLAAAARCGVHNVLVSGGAQAIAAMAYGSESVPKCLKLFGPGNAWVTEAKQQVSADPEGAAIDMPAGPSEVMVIADASASPEFVAADLLSQCEHGPDSHAVLVTDSAGLAAAVEAELERQTEQLSRDAVIRQSLVHAVAILTDDITAAVAVANQYASEHLILQVSEPADQVEHVINAGSVFVGPWSPEAIGDYCSGTNHVLPTYGYARAHSGVSCASFVKFMTVQTLTGEGLEGIGPTAITLAEAEGLDAHARAVSMRLDQIARRVA